MENLAAASFALSREREASAATSAFTQLRIAGSTRRCAIGAVLRMPHFTFWVISVFARVSQKGTACPLSALRKPSEEDGGATKNDCADMGHNNVVPVRRETKDAGLKARRYKSRCFSVHPVEGARDGLFPLTVIEVAVRFLHVRFPDLVYSPILPQIVEIGVVAARQASGVGGSERGGLFDDGTNYGNIQNIGLELHEKIVLDHAAIGAQREQVDFGIFFHGFKDFASLISGGFEAT